MLTADFITPPVDDPEMFGQIAAANALSDVYAMGGRPIACLNLVGFPEGELGPEVLHGIIRGALTKVTEAGAVLAGGHTTVDAEPKFGLSVAGLVHPQRVWRNVGCRPGDGLILTKPIGSGVLFNANRKGRVSAEAMRTCLDTLTTLNRVAAETLAAFRVHAATDITGFGLAGHAHEMAKGSDAVLHIGFDLVPCLPESRAMYQQGFTTGVNRANRARIDRSLRFSRDLGRDAEEMLVDPQTSGGLLVALPEDEVDGAIAALRQAGVGAATRIGTVAASDGRPGLVIS